MVVSSFIFVFVVQFPTSIACWKHVKPCLKKWSLMLKSRKKDTPLVWSNQTIFFCFFFSERTPHIFLRIHVPICWRNLMKSPRCHGCFNVAMARHRSSAVAWRAARSWKRSSSSCDRNSPEPLRRVASRWSRWVCGGSLWLMFIKQILLYS